MTRKAWLVVNEFLDSEKFNEIHSWLVDAGKRRDIDLIIRTNAELISTIGTKSLENKKEDDPLFILFWDKDVYLAKHLELLGYRVFNSSEAIAICDDKALTHLALSSEGIDMPKTMIAPKTFEGIGYVNYDFLEKIKKELGLPLIIKECFGSFGQQVYKVDDEKALYKKVKEIGVKPMLFQEYVETSFARDVRLNVVGDQVVASMYRYSETGDFRANVTIGGSMQIYVPTEEQKELAIKCCNIIGLDFAGVDLLFGKNEKPVVCEVNSNAHFKNIFDCTGINVADLMIEYILNQDLYQGQKL